MMIDIRKSIIFTEDPAKRFSKMNDVPTKLFNELWRRYAYLEYSVPELCIYFHIKVGIPIEQRKMHDWVLLNKIYLKAQAAIQKGANVVDSSFFGDLEPRLIRYLTRKLKYQKTKDIHCLI